MEFRRNVLFIDAKFFTGQAYTALAMTCKLLVLSLVMLSFVWIMKVLIAALFVLICNYSYAQDGELKGRVLDKNTMKGVPFSKIKIYLEQTLIQETISDSLGNYHLKLKPSKIDISCEAEHYKKAAKAGIRITEGKTSFANIELVKN